MVRDAASNEPMVNNAEFSRSFAVVIEIGVTAQIVCSAPPYICHEINGGTPWILDQIDADDTIGDLSRCVASANLAGARST